MCGREDRKSVVNSVHILNIYEIYGYDEDDLPDSAYPIIYRNIEKAQKTDAKLQQKLVSHKYYTLDNSVGATKTIVWYSKIARYSYPQQY